MGNGHVISIYPCIDDILPVCTCVLLPVYSIQFSTIVYSVYVDHAMLWYRVANGVCHHNKAGNGHQTRWLLSRGWTGEKVSSYSLF